MTWEKIFEYCYNDDDHDQGPEEAIDLISKFLVYVPSNRIGALEALTHPFFDQLRDKCTKLPNGNQLPPLINLTNDEIEFIKAKDAQNKISQI